MEHFQWLTINLASIPSKNERSNGKRLISNAHFWIGSDLFQNLSDECLAFPVPTHCLISFSFALLLIENTYVQLGFMTSAV